MSKVVRLNDDGTIRDELGRLGSGEFGGPVAVVVGGSINGLGVARALARASIPVVLLTDSLRVVARRSRSVKLTVICDDVYYANLVQNLRVLGAYFEIQPILYLTHDFQVSAVVDGSAELQRHFRFLLPDQTRVESMLDKSEFWKLAQKAGLTVPETHIFDDARELLGFLRHSDYEKTWVVKPFRKSDTFEGRFGKAQFLRSEIEWKAFVRSYSDMAVPTLVQEMIPGPDTNVMFALVVFDAASKPVMTFSGRKIRQYKPVVGNTASAEPFNSPSVLQETVSFFDASRFIGMGSLEFKLHAEDGRLYVIEPTVGRTNLQSEVAVINGFNLPAAYFWTCCDAKENLKDVLEEASRRQPHRVWIRFGADLKSSWHYWRRGDLSLAQWICPFSKRLKFAVFRWTDPVPSLFSAGRSCVSFAIRAVKSVLGKKTNRAR